MLQARPPFISNPFWVLARDKVILDARRDQFHCAEQQFEMGDGTQAKR
jgi:hypothetical protein